MARTARYSSPASEADDYEHVHNGNTSTRRVPRGASNNAGPLSPSPAASFSSDKENRQNTTIPSHLRNGKGKNMAPPNLPTTASADSRAHKRRRLGERDAPNPSQLAHERQLEQAGNIDYYDPDQSMEERRAVRKGFRDLSRELQDSRTEYLSPASTGLKDTVLKANDLFQNVKQTSDATLDSRLLVSTADLSAKRTTQLNFGDATQGIDVDEFISKCVTFMRRGPSGNATAAANTGASQRRRRQVNNEDDDASAVEGSADEGDALNWEWLGRQACFPHNVRPPVPGFLLGPLSVKKKLRQQTQRRERLQRRDPNDAVRPEELKSRDLEKVENSNLTTLCTNIRKLLAEKQNYGLKMSDLEAPEESSSEDYRLATMAKYGLADDSGIPFFNFVINPKCFGQTVENLFYVSFLVRDGSAGVGSDANMLPTLHATIARTPKEIQDEKVQKNQAVFHIDFQTWEDLIESFGIEESIIPHRLSDEGAQVSSTGWYG